MCTTRELFGLTLLVTAACVGDIRTAALQPDGPGGALPHDPDTSPPVPCTRAGPGRVTAHRLNATEYDNTVRDLLGDTSRPSATFPAQDSAFGFDNIAEALTIDPLLFEAYEATAESVANAAVAREVALPSPQRLWLGCDATPATEASCARSSLSALLPRAFRRPVAPTEVDRIVAQYDFARAQGETFASGLAVALKAVLLSPSFLFRVEPDVGAAEHAISDHELASRLSYFVWSSMPDGALRALADEGRLHDEAVLAAQLRRMLDDPKAQAFVENFTGQWLELRGLEGVNPDTTLFPSFDAPLQQAMRRETELTFATLLRADQSFLDVLDLDYTFVDDRLASHYGLPAVGATQRVQLNGTERGGLLTHASLLTVTSNADRTSPVRRGQFVLAQLLCSEPPPPPADVPPLPAAQPNSGTLRQQLEAHRSNPSCKGCHAQMDPIGFSLEGFDAIGAHRTTEAGQVIDVSGSFPDGRSFTGAKALESIVKADPRLADCVSRKLATYALGRLLGSADACAVTELTGAAANKGYRLAAWLEVIVQAPLFTRRTPGAP